MAIKKDDLIKLIDTQSNRLAELLPSHIPVEKFVSVLKSYINDSVDKAVVEKKEHSSILTAEKNTIFIAIEKSGKRWSLYRRERGLYCCIFK
jgi:hypothetical protein